jgi:nitroreductase
MDVHETIQKRRAYRSLVSCDISDGLIEELARSARLAPSCFNNQPWRFVFVRHPKMLQKMHDALTSGNVWAHAASMIIAVFSRKEDDCIIRDRIYHQFDCGLAAGFLILRATEMGFVAHPIAGFSPKKTRAILGIPDEYKVITLIIVGKKTDKISPVLSDQQASREKRRPRRKKISDFAFIDRYGKSSENFEVKQCHT